MKTLTIPVLAAMALGGLTSATCRGLDFGPQLCDAQTLFVDVPADDPACQWIEQTARDGILTGCGGGRFCPHQPVRRAEVAAFLERGMRGTATWTPAAGYYARTLVVSPVPGNPLQSGAALLAARQAALVANATDRFLIKLEPGIYDLTGTLGLDVPAYVDLEGSGIGTTLILAQDLLDSDLVSLPGQSEARLLTVRNEKSAGNPVGLGTFGPGERRLRQVRIESLHGRAVACDPGGILRIAHAVLESQALAALTINGCQAEVTDSQLATQGANLSSPKAVVVAGGGVLELRRSDVVVGAYNGGNVGIAASDATLTLEAVHVRVDSASFASAFAHAVTVARSNTAIVASDLETTGVALNRFVLRASSDAGSYLTRVRDSRLSNGTIEASPFDGIRIAESQLDDAVVDANGGAIVCHKVFDQAFANAGGLGVCP